MIFMPNFSLYRNIKCCFVCSMRSFFDFVKKLDGESEPGIRPGGVPVYTPTRIISPILTPKPTFALTLILILLYNNYLIYFRLIYIISVFTLIYNNFLIYFTFIVFNLYLNSIPIIISSYFTIFTSHLTIILF